VLHNIVVIEHTIKALQRQFLTDKDTFRVNLLNRQIRLSVNHKFLCNVICLENYCPRQQRME